MTQEDKDLLLCDLCARLPYGVKVQIKNEIVVLDSICDDDGYHFNFIGDNREGVNVENVKPFLFPLSSMTEEQVDELYRCSGAMLKRSECISLDFHVFEFAGLDNALKYLDRNHFDYRGLIPKGLALDATGLGIY